MAAATNQADFDLLHPPAPAALCDDDSAQRNFAADLDYAEMGYEEIKTTSRLRKVATEGSAFGRAETLVGGESSGSSKKDNTEVTDKDDSDERDEKCEKGSSRSTGNTASVCTDSTCLKGCNGYHKIIRENYQDFPSGWPRLAAFYNTADSFSMFRRFGRAHCRLLLHLEAEITVLERKLDALDKQDTDTPGLLYRLRRCSWDAAWDQEQKSLMDELKEKIVEYDDLLTKDHALRSLDRPPKRNYLHMFDWIFGTKPLDEGHYDFINHQADMVFTANYARNADGFDRFVEGSLSKWPSSPLQRCLQSRKTGNEKKKDTEGGQVIYFSKRRILIVAKLIAVSLSVAILLLPVFILALVTMKRQVATSLVLIFVLAFAMLMSLFAGAKAETVFLSTCAYCAVLVTFLGNVQGSVGTAALA